MSRLIITEKAVQDIQRLHEFLKSKAPEAASRARKKLQDSIKAIPDAPKAHRPVHELPEHREMIVPFGRDGYIVRYRYAGKSGIAASSESPVTILRIWHQREDRFDPSPSPR